MPSGEQGSLEQVGRPEPHALEEVRQHQAAEEPLFHERVDDVPQHQKCRESGTTGHAGLRIGGDKRHDIVRCQRQYFNDTSDHERHDRDAAADGQSSDKSAAVQAQGRKTLANPPRVADPDSLIWPRGDGLIWPHLDGGRG